MKKFRKAVALLLVVCMLTSGNMSLFANAAESNSVSEIGTDMFYRVFHLDAARKYFSAAEIKELIKIAADGGYNQFELYLADNQGFRFALDDMWVEVDEDHRYNLTPSLGAGYSAAPHYTDGVDKWLTEDEMDDIIAYANSKGIGIVPCINAPGHMGTILEGVKDQISNLQYSTTINGATVTSKSALNLENEEAYAFGLALIEKYATYFASKGIKYLNIGADEYAADLTDLTTGANNGMDLLYNAGGYLRFVDFVNDAATIIKELEMTPRAYNDCIYYNNSDTYSEGQYTNEPVLFDKDIEICYWNGAWTWGDTTGDDVPDWFRRADATYLADKGFKMINTNGSYYHVLGTGGETGDNRQIETATSVQSFDINNFHTFANTNKYVEISNPAGAMFCIWCDNATNDLDETAYTGPASWVIETSRDAIIAFGQNVISQKAPTTKTVDLKVGETYTETFKGRPTVAYEAMDPTIAEQTTTVNEGEKELGDLVEGTVTSGEYYLYDGSNYLGVGADTKPTVVSENNAKTWDITIDSSTKAATIKQDDYYLVTEGDFSCKLSTDTTTSYSYMFDKDKRNVLYVTFNPLYYILWRDTWLGGLPDYDDATAYFRPYEVVDPTTTTITFDAKKAGTTYAYIGDVEYTINVTSDEPELQTEVIDLKEGETSVITVDGDVCIDYNTDNTDIATVTTSLDDGKVVANKFTESMVAGEYYLGNGDKYLIEKDGTWAMVNAAEALPWTVTFDSNTGEAIIQQDSYYLSNIPNAKNTFDVKILTTLPEYPFGFNSAFENAVYLEFEYNSLLEKYYVYWETSGNGYLGAQRTIDLAYFSPYEVETIETPATNLVFEGKKEGTTYVTIGDVRYQINVTADEVAEPDPEPGVDKVITIEVGGSHTEQIDGNKTGDHPTKDTTIATVVATPGAVETTYSVGNPVTSTMSSGEYYLGNGSDYFVVKNGSGAVVDAANAIPWTITISDAGVATIQQGNYYLYSYYHASAGLQCVIDTISPAVYSYKFDAENRLYVEYSSNLYIYWNYEKGWFSATESPSAYFRPYEAVKTNTTTSTDITFRGHKEGTTYVTIGDVTYQINVVLREVEVTVPVGTSVDVQSDETIIGSYQTEDPHIAIMNVSSAGTSTGGVGDPVTNNDIIGGKYYLGHDGLFLIVKDGKFTMVGADEAIPWDMTITSNTTTDDVVGGGTTIKEVTMVQNGYYLSNQDTSGTLEIKPLYTLPTYGFKLNGDNEMYISYGGYRHYVRWQGAYVAAETYNTSNNYFRIYAADGEISSAKSTITFEGKKEGTTYVTIGGTRYKVIVTENDNLDKKYINLKVNHIHKEEINGDVSGIYMTEDTTIATVTTTLRPGNATFEPVTGTVPDGLYYLGIGGQYLKANGGYPYMTDAANAVPWEVYNVDGGVVIKQGNYYLSNTYNETTGEIACEVSTIGAALSYVFDSENNNALYFVNPSDSAKYYTYYNTNYVAAETYENTTTAYFQPYVVNSSTSTKTILDFYGYKAGETSVIIGGVEYVITVTEEEPEVINITIPLGEEVIYKQPANVEDVVLPEDAFVDIDLLYRRQDAYTWVANPQANTSYYIMGIEQHYLAIEDGKFVTIDNPEPSHKWTVIPTEGGFSLKYGDYYLVNHWHDGVMTLEFLEEDTSAFPWQFDQNRGIYCTDKVETYRLAHNPNTHQWELNNKTTRRIGFSEVDINEGTYATEITFVGKKVGNTTVVIGNKTYNITVTEAVAPEMDAITIEYWITNNRCADTDGTNLTNPSYGNNSYTIEYGDTYTYVDESGNTKEEIVASEEGMRIGGLVAHNATRLNQHTQEFMEGVLVFWRTSIHADGFHQEIGQEARTTTGTFFDRIRFWHGKWSVSGDGVAWRVLEEADQLVAYYIQKTDVTQEVITYAMDWGNPNATNGGYDNAYDSSLDKDYSYVLLDFAVQYESGLRNPDDFPRAETIGFHCDHADINVAKAVHPDAEGYWYRTLGVIQAEAIEGFEVYMITLTPNTDVKDQTLSKLKTSPTGVDYTYAGTEKVVWIDDEANLGMFADPSLRADGYHVGGTPYVPEINIYEHQAMLVTYYVRAVEPENALEVHYHDATGLDTSNPETLENAPEFYMYNISVKGDTVFPEAGTIYVGNDGKLYGATVENSLEVNETVTSVLSDMPAIPVQYRYGQYTFATFSLKNNNTQLHLYYTSTDPIYVVDFGLSVDVDLELDENLDAEILAKPKYGTAEIKDGVLTYKPTTVICNIDIVTVKVIAENQDGSTDTVNRTYRFYPATTVYYEEGFMNIANSSWGEAGTALSDKQTTTLLGQYKETPDYVYNYGYDDSYSTQENGASNGTYLVSTDPSGYAEFTFTGTGVDIYANCTPDSGSINVLVRNSAGKLVKMLQINTKMAEDGSATGGQAVNAYNIPVASIDFGTTHDTYTVQIRHIKTVVNNSPASSPVQLDGFRVYNTLQDSNVYKDDKEANPTFVEVRDMIFGGFGAESIAEAVVKDENNPSSGSDYFEDYTAEQLGKAMSQVLNLSGGASGVDSTATALIIDGNKGHDNTYVQDLLDNGPKNEVYLFPDQSLVFKPAKGIDVQVGLKAINAAVTCEINGVERVISSSTDMFYELGTMDGETAVTITNVSGGILSITDMKWMSSDTTGNPEAEPVMMLEEADFVRTFMLMGFRSSTPAPEPEPVVEEEILYQTNDNSTDVRLIAYLDDLSEYEKVAFTLTIDGRTSKELVCSTAYAELYAGGELYTTEDIYGVDGYFVTYTINRYLEVYAGKEVTITVTYTTVTGETVTAERTVTIE